MTVFKELDESIKDYFTRICSNREAFGLLWDDVKDLMNKETGKQYTESKYRKQWTNYKEGLEDGFRKAIDEDATLKEYEMSLLKIKEEKVRLSDQRASYTRMIRKNARQEEMLAIVKEIMSKGGEEKPFAPIVVKSLKSDNDLVVNLNDLHVGADVNNAWNVYNSDVCRTYLEEYLSKIIEIKKLHNSENCYIFANGDLINGNIHYEIAVENKEHVILQLKKVSSMIANFIYEISKNFSKVYFGVVAGNHSRISKKEDSLREERLDDLVIWYLEAKLQNVKNVFFVENIDVSMNTVIIRSKEYLNAHGDLESSEKAYTSLSLMGGHNIYAIFCGHKHHNSSDYVNNVKVLMSGSLIGIDSFCIQHRIVGIPQQIVCVCNEDGILATYDINFKKYKRNL
jgi:hypothetical protein